MPTPTDRFGLDTYDPGESWDHTDTVQFLDESAIEVDTIANRPTSGSYDGELFFATDQRILYQWDAGGSSWDVELGLGVDGTPVPGTSHFEALEAETLVGADVLNASENQILVAQGDGTLAVETQAQGPNPYDQAQSFSESGITLTQNKTRINNGSIEIGYQTGATTSRTADSSQATGATDGRGLIINPNRDFDALKATVSQNTATGNPFSDIYIADTNENILVENTGGFTAGDTVILEPTNGLASGTDYILGAYNDGNTWAEGYYDSPSYPISGTDIDISNSVFNAHPDDGSGLSFGSNLRCFNNLTALDATNSADAIIEWDRGIPTDIFEWDVATFTRTLDNETVDVFVAYSFDGGSTWTRTNSGNPITRNYSLNEDANITPNADVRIEAELSRADMANNPTLDSVYRSWLV